MRYVRVAFELRLEPGEDADLLLQAGQGFQLRREGPLSVACLFRNPARTAGDDRRQTEAPEVGAEAERQLRAVGVRLAISIQENVQSRNADADGRSAMSASK